MGLLNRFLKKKTVEEQFFEAVRKQDLMEVERLGQKLLQINPNNLLILNPYVDALVKLNKKEEAVNVLINFAQEKLREDYHDLAIPILKKILKIDPLNLKAIKLLANAYKKKELFYEAFNILLDSYKKFKETGIKADSLKEQLEDFIKEQFHPLFYEKYAHLLEEEGDYENALVNYVLAANLYIKLQNYKAALKALLKARNIRKTESIDRQIIEVLSQIDDVTTIKNILPSTLVGHRENDDEFLKFVISSFKETDKLKLLKEITKELQIPKLKYALLSLINFEFGEIEEGQEYLQKLKLIDRNLYEQIKLDIKNNFHEAPLLLEDEEAFENEGELPEPEQVLEILDQVININDVVSEYENRTETTIPKISEEIKTLKEFEKDGRKALSTAEALLGLGKYDEAIEAAKSALNTENGFRATALIAEAMIEKGELQDALSFLLEAVKNPEFSEEEKARLKVLIGDVHRLQREPSKALLWYKEAYKVLKDPEIESKIAELKESQAV